MPRRERNPSTAFWVGIGIALVAGGAVTLYALRARAKKPLPRSKAMPPEEAVTAAIDQLGVDAHPYALTDFAYALAYPECPTVPDENDPSHDRCRGLWLDMSIRVRDRLGLDPDAPVEPAPEKMEEGIAKQLCDFFDSLTASQKKEVRSIVREDRYDNLVSTCEAGNDAAVRAQILSLRKEVEKLFKDHPLDASMLYFQLRDVLGEQKVEEFLDIVK
jgi:hypothetical protein